jgi:flagellar motor switch protein FliM
MATEEILSTEEISALLPENHADDAATEREKRRRIVPYNFRRPDRLSKEHVRSLYLLHDQFANNLSSSLPLFLRTASEVALISVEQQSYSDYLRGLADPTMLFTVAARSMQGVFVVELGSTVAFPIIDRMLGGEGREPSELRPATELEMKVLEGFLSILLSSYSEVWKTYSVLETEIVGRETRPQMLQVVPPNEVVATVSYQLQVGEMKGSMSICLPVALLEPVADAFSRSAYSPDNRTEPEETASLLSAVADVRFPVTCELEAVSVPVSELNLLRVGDVLRINHAIEKPLNICVANNPKFHGRLASLEGKLVAQVTDPNEPIVSTAVN